MPNLRFPAGLALLTLIAALAASIAIGCGGDDDAPSAGEDPGALTVYSGRSEDLIAPVIDDFEETTGTEVEVRYGDTAELAVTLTEEGDASPADVYIAQDAGALGAIEAEGLFAKLPKSLTAIVDPRFRSSEDLWTGISGRARVIAYGESIAADEVPDSVFDLVDSAWSGRVGWAPTNGSFQAFATAMRGVFGDEETLAWIEGMVANDVQEYSDNVSIRDAIEAGEVDLGLINHYYVAQAKAEDPDYPVEVSYPASDVGSLVNVAGAGILASSDKRKQAIPLIAFMLSRDSQEYFAESSKEYPLIEGIKTDPGIPPLSEVKAPDIDLSAISDLEGTLELLREGGAL